jgi:hypothetical protein
MNNADSYLKWISNERQEYRVAPENARRRNRAHRSRHADSGKAIVGQANIRSAQVEVTRKVQQDQHHQDD